MSESHLPVHVAEAVTFGLAIAGFLCVRRRRHATFFRVVTALGWANVALFAVREALSGFPSPWAGANENIESSMWLADVVLSALAGAVFVHAQALRGRVARPWPWIVATLLLGPSVSLPAIFPRVLDAEDAGTDADAPPREPLRLAAYAAILVVSLGVLVPHLPLFAETGGAFVLRSVTNPANTYAIGSICVLFPAVVAFCLPRTRNVGVRVALATSMFMFVAVGFTIFLLMRGARRGATGRGAARAA